MIRAAGGKAAGGKATGDKVPLLIRKGLAPSCACQLIALDKNPRSKTNRNW